jgi:hypothetical protein
MNEPQKINPTDWPAYGPEEDKWKAEGTIIPLKNFEKWRKI